MGWLILLIVGGVLGWLASLVMRTDGQQGLFLNVVVGIVGALLGGFVAPMLGITGANIAEGNLSFQSIAVSFVGALILLALVNLVRRGRIR